MRDSLCDQRDQSSDWDDYLDICVRADGGDWVALVEFGDGDGTGAWEDLTVDLSDYVDATSLEVGFHYYDEGNWSFAPVLMMC